MNEKKSALGKRVIITTSVFGQVSDALDLLTSAGLEVDMSLVNLTDEIDADERLRRLKNCDGIIAGTERIDAKLIASLDRLKVISRVGVGLDGIDFSAVRERNIEVCFTPDAVSLPVAEMTVGLVLCLARRICRADRGMRRKVWQRFIGPELNGRTVGIVGLGRIGKLVAKLFRAFGMKILANDIEPDLNFAEEHGVELVDKDRLYTDSDFVTLHVPLNEATRGLINEDVFTIMKTSAFLINTSRGSVVNDEDLHRALVSNEIAGAAIDVFYTEPYQGPLAELENVILTCHMASCSDKGRMRMETQAAQNIIDYFSGKIPAGRVPNELRV